MELIAPEGIASLRDVEEIERIPLSERGLAASTYEIFQRSAGRFPDAVALRYLFTADPEADSWDYTYRDMLDRVTRAANVFTGLGVGRGDAVSILMPNLPQNHFVLWGAEAAGIANPINPMLEPSQIAGIMTAAGSKVLVTVAPFPGVDLWEKAAAVASEVPGLEAILTIDMHQFLEPGATPQVPEHASLRVDDLDRRMAAESGDALKAQPPGPDDVAGYFHTGGTTGTPKLAMHHHSNEVANAWQMAQWFTLTPEDSFFVGLPLFHVNAPIATGLAPFTGGAGVVLATPQGYRNPDVLANFWPLVERYRVSFFMAVPTVYTELLGRDSEPYDLSSLRFAVCGAAPMSVEVINRFQEKTGLKIIEGYGCTEGTAASCINPTAGERKVGSIGIRLPYQQMKVVEVGDDGRAVRDCGPEEVGHIVIKGPNVFPGYKQTEKNEGIWAEDGWYNTGDLGRQDADGYFWLTGRAKDLIIRGGHNIDPAIIEEAFHQHPAVAECAAVGKPDARAGELPIVYVTLAEGEKATAEELREFVAERIPERAAVPREVYIIEQMPVTAVGKIFKPDLRNDAVARVYDEALAPLREEGVDYEVDVQAHKRYGQLATIRLKPGSRTEEVEQRIAELLAPYSVHYHVT